MRYERRISSGDSERLDVVEVDGDKPEALAAAVAMLGLGKEKAVGKSKTFGAWWEGLTIYYSATDDHPEYRAVSGHDGWLLTREGALALWNAMH